MTFLTSLLEVMMSPFLVSQDTPKGPGGRPRRGCCRGVLGLMEVGCSDLLRTPAALQELHLLRSEFSSGMEGRKKRRKKRAPGGAEEEAGTD